MMNFVLQFKTFIACKRTSRLSCLSQTFIVDVKLLKANRVSLLTNISAMVRFSVRELILVMLVVLNIIDVVIMNACSARPFVTRIPWMDALKKMDGERELDSNVFGVGNSAESRSSCCGTMFKIVIRGRISALIGRNSRRMISLGWPGIIPVSCLQIVFSRLYKCLQFNFVFVLAFLIRVRAFLSGFSFLCFNINNTVTWSFKLSWSGFKQQKKIERDKWM